jgi:hypothetical protein
MITKLSPRVPSGVAILSHPRGEAQQPSIDFGVFFCFFVNKGVGYLESSPSILVTRNPNWSFRYSKARDWLRKGKVLAPLVRPT